MADSVKIQIDLAANPAAAKRLEEAFKNLGSTARKAGHDASRGFDGASAKMDAFGKKLGGLKTLFAAAFAGIGIKSFADAAIESENALVSLDARIKATGGSAGLSRDRLIELSKSLQKVTTSSDETILSAETLLLSFRRIRGPAFEGALTAALDLSAGLKQDLQTSILEVGKALQSPIDGLTALQRAGVRFTDSQKDQIRVLVETGRLQEAQKLILDALAQSFGGSATAAANTFGGALTQLKNAFDDLLEGSGGNMPEATKAVHDLTTTLNDPDVKAGFDAINSGLFWLARYAALGTAGTASLIGHLRDLAILKLGGAINPDADDVERQRLFNTLLSDKLDLDRQIAEIESNPISRTIGALSLKNLKEQRDAIVDRMRAEQDDEKARTIARQNEALDSRLKKGATSIVEGIFGDPASEQASTEAQLEALKSKREAAAREAIQRAQQLQQAWAALSGQLNAIDAQVAGPGAQAWAKYADTVAKAAQAGGAVIAKGGDVAQVQAIVAGIMQKAAIARDAELKKAADEAGKAQQDVLKWITATRAELEGPTAVAVKEYTDKVAELRKLLDAGSLTQTVFDAGVQAARDKLLQATKATTDQITEFWRQAARNSQDALAQFLFDPFQDGLRGMVRGVADAIRKIASQMLAANIFKGIGSFGSSQGGMIGAALSMFGGASAYGNVFHGGALIPHAAGDVIGRPTLFPMSGGRTGLMGEAGPEAIMPLVRASTGHLGVRAVGGGDAAVAVRIVNNIDPQTISDALATSAGEKVILNTIRRNTAGIKQLLR